jgi:hypothetical protein
MRDMEATEFGWSTEMWMEGTETALGTSCRMER